MRELTTDPRGIADWIEREAQGMDPMQLYREFVQNAVEAGATRIIIDGWTDPETGHILARITDNGSGLTAHQLINRLSCLHGKFKGAANYGVGARIAALPSNRAGVTFASRTATSEAMMTLHKEHGRFGAKTWEVDDDDGYSMRADTVAPDEGMLYRLDDEQTGTAVILHGDGHCDTWDNGISYRVRAFISRRYFDFAEPVDIKVFDAKTISARWPRWWPVTSLRAYFSKYSAADGEVPFSDIAGLSGTMRWWIIPSATEALANVIGSAAVGGGVGLVVENEIFDYNSAYQDDFGIIYKPVRARVAVLVFVDGAAMDTARSAVVFPGENRKSTPWKKFGAHFAANMPDEVDALLSAVTVKSSSFDAEIAKMLDKDWMAKLNPVQVNVSHRDGEPSTGADDGDATPPGRDVEIAEKSGLRPPRRKRRVAPQRDQSGNSPGKPKFMAATPSVQFVPADEFDKTAHPFGITWISVKNVILVSDDFPPYLREVGRWIEGAQRPAQLIEAAVQGAYAVEYAATIIDANAQAKFKLEPDQIEQLKSDAALYAKALGMQSLTVRIEAYIKAIARNA